MMGNSHAAVSRVLQHPVILMASIIRPKQGSFPAIVEETASQLDQALLVSTLGPVESLNSDPRRAHKEARPFEDLFGKRLHLRGVLVGVAELPAQLVDGRGPHSTHPAEKVWGEPGERRAWHGHCDGMGYQVIKWYEYRMSKM